MVKPFRFGVMMPRAADAGELRETARKAEDLGYSTLFVPDHFVEHPLAPLPTCAAVAAVTTTLRVGTLVLGNDYRHPVVTARDAATVDVISDGRLELGIGAGWMQADYDKAGLRYDPPRERIERLAESIAIIKGLFADGPFTFEGDYYTVRDLDGHPKPVQQPVPFLIGGGAPKILALAAREAAIVGINANLRAGYVGDDATTSLTGAATDQKVAWLRDAAGARFDELEIQTLVGLVHETDDRPTLAAGVADAFGVSTEVALETPALLAGTMDEIAADVEARRRRWGINYQVIPHESIETFAPVVARLAGT